MAPKRSKSAKPSARAAALKRSQAARKAAATRKRNARRGMKDVPPVTIKVDATQHSASTPREIADAMKDALRYSLHVNRAYEQAYVAQTTNDPNLWRTATGALVHVHQMTDEHLRNTVSYLARRLSRELTSVAFLRSLQPFLDKFSAMLSECRRRGMQV